MNLSPLPVQKFFSNLGLPLVGGKLFTYVAGTTTKLATYQNQAGTPNSNPIVLNFRGECNLWLDKNLSYKFVLAPPTDSDPPVNPFWTVDNITAPVGLSDLTIQVIGQIIYPRTQAEINTGIFPVSYAWPAYQSPRYGVLADGITNDLSAFQNMLTAAQGVSTGPNCALVELISNNSSIILNGGVSFDYGLMMLDGRGNTVDFSNVTVGAFTGVRLTASTENLNLIGIRYGARGVHNLIILMPSYTVNALGVGMELVDLVPVGPDYRGPRHKLDGISILGGNQGLRLGAGAFGECITGLTIGHDTGHLLNIGIYAPSDWSTTDGGEAPTFVSAFVFNGQVGVQLDGAGGITFLGGNFDGLPTISYQKGNGLVMFIGTYSEFTEGDNTQFKYRVEDANAVLKLSDCDYVVRQDVLNTRTKPLINVTGTVILENLTFRGNNIQWYSPTNGGFLCDGAGLVHAQGLLYPGFPWAPLPSKSRQWMAYPDCDNANVLVTWTLTNSGAFNPVRVTGVTDGAGVTRDVIRFQINNAAASGSFSRAFFTRAVTIGKRATFCGQAFGPMTGSNVIFEMTVTHKDVGGNALFTQTTTLVSVTQANYTTFGGDIGTFDKGVVTLDIQIQLRATGVVNGNVIFNVSPFALGYADGP